MRTDGAAAHHHRDQGSESERASLTLGLSTPGVRGLWKAQSARRHVGKRSTQAGGQKRRETDVLERLWGWRTCDRCGHTMMLGEGTFRLRLDRITEEVCLDCASAPRDSSRGPASGPPHHWSAGASSDPAAAHPTSNHAEGERR